MAHCDRGRACGLDATHRIRLKYVYKRVTLLYRAPCLGVASVLRNSIGEHALARCEPNALFSPFDVCGSVLHSELRHLRRIIRIVESAAAEAEGNQQTVDGITKGDGQCSRICGRKNVGLEGAHYEVDTGAGERV